MSELPLSPVLLAGAPDASALRPGGSAKDDPAKVRDAAQQFEALLLGQILREVHESGGGWLGSGEDATGECATDFAEQQFARLLAEQGGLGLAALISQGLTQKRGPAG